MFCDITVPKTGYAQFDFYIQLEAGTGRAGGGWLGLRVCIRYKMDLKVPTGYSLALDFKSQQKLDIKIQQAPRLQ